MRYVRIFDCISEHYIAFTKDDVEVRKQALAFVPARYIRTSEMLSEHERHLFGVSELLCVFHNVMSIYQKLLKRFEP